jgi:hypothetical protein
MMDFNLAWLCFTAGISRIIFGLMSGHFITADYWDAFKHERGCQVVELVSFSLLVVGIYGLLPYI